MKNRFRNIWLIFTFAIAFTEIQTANAVGILPVPTETIYPGQKITEDKLRDARFYDVFIERGGHIRNRGELLGKIAKKTLIKGRPIPLGATRRSFVINSGQLVTLRYRSGMLTITAKAVSLNSAMEGQAVSVRNIDSGQVIIGVARRGNYVEVGPK